MHCINDRQASFSRKKKSGCTLRGSVVANVRRTQIYLRRLGYIILIIAMLLLIGYQMPRAHRKGPLVIGREQTNLQVALNAIRLRHVFNSTESEV